MAGFAGYNSELRELAAVISRVRGGGGEEEEVTFFFIRIYF